jgi:hypothetical protein
VGRALGIALVAFGLAYACLWWSFQRFYAVFGVSPQDVGLAPSGSSADLAGAALQLGIWLLIALVVFAVVPTLAVLCAEVARAAGRKRRALPWALAVLLAIASGWLYKWIDDGWGKGLGVIGTAAAIFAAVQYGLPGALRVLMPKRTLPPAFAGLDPRPPPQGLEARLERAGVDRDVGPRLRLAFAIFLAAAVVGITFLDLPDDAEEAAKCAANGWGTVPAINVPLPHLHLPILSVRAQRARLWLSGKKPPVHVGPLRVVYLGQAGGDLVVYDIATKKTNRIPSGNAIVTIRPHAWKCKAVH